MSMSSDIIALEFRCSGTYSFERYCSKCNPLCLGHEEFATISDVSIVADGRVEAERTLTKQYLSHQNAQWLYDSPRLEVVRIIQVGSDLSNYWEVSESEKRKLRTLAGKR